jgi:tRNA dimethylallyltransferase
VILKGFFPLTLDARKRASFSRSIEGTPTSELYTRLEAVDTESAQRIHANDRYRIVRALEVYTLTGVPLSEHFRKELQETVVPDIGFVKVGLDLPRDELYRRINARTVRMIESGWIEEVERLIEGGADPAWPGMKTLGYPEIIAFLRDEISREHMIERIARQTRQYAKRQCTWFRGEEGVRWFQPDGDITLRVLDYVT